MPKQPITSDLDDLLAKMRDKLVRSGKGAVNELAARLGCDHSSINQYRRGIARPRTPERVAALRAWVEEVAETKTFTVTLTGALAVKAERLGAGGVRRIIERALK